MSLLAIKLMLHYLLFLHLNINKLTVKSEKRYLKPTHRRREFRVNFVDKFGLECHRHHHLVKVKKINLY